jgi:hypothetical protein
MIDLYQFRKLGKGVLKNYSGTFLPNVASLKEIVKRSKCSPEEATPGKLDYCLFSISKIRHRVVQKTYTTARFSQTSCRRKNGGDKKSSASKISHKGVHKLCNGEFLPNGKSQKKLQIQRMLFLGRQSWNMVGFSYLEN